MVELYLYFSDRLPECWGKDWGERKTKRMTHSQGPQAGLSGATGLKTKSPNGLHYTR